MVSSGIYQSTIDFPEYWIKSSMTDKLIRILDRASTGSGIRIQYDQLGPIE